MADTNTHSCVVQAETLAKFLVAVSQLDEYASSGRTPLLVDRVDDQPNLRITFSYVEPLNLG